MFRNAKLAVKITFGFVMVLLIAVALGGTAVYNMRQIGQDVTALAEQYVPEVTTATQVERRIELAGQGIALEAAAEHEMPGRVTIRAKPARTETTKPGALDTWDVSVISTDGEVLAERKVLLSHVFLYETQALVDTLAPLGLFRAGEEALSLFRDDDAEPMAGQLEFSYRLPQVEPEPDERHRQQTKEDAPAAGTPPLDEQILGELLQYAAFRLWVRHRHSA